jgi:hypothetical protein
MCGAVHFGKGITQALPSWPAGGGAIATGVTLRVIVSEHAFVQNVRRRHYELAVEEPANRRVAVAIEELALVLIPEEATASARPASGERNSANLCLHEPGRSA